ncbi:MULTISPECIES: hypothetical protein [unclassified Frankia]|uniref:hypothetical protein n=1 Tax=unclassified Frankia TaxID=2632575 RepID=UPI002AD2D6EE|nr:MULTISPECIES: hypothetical protein [unclassified Frankia]
MDEFTPELKTVMVDLSAVPLAELRSLKDPLLTGSMRHVLAEIDDPSQVFYGYAPPPPPDLQHDLVTRGLRASHRTGCQGEAVRLD